MSRRKQTSELSFYSNDYGTFRWTAEEGVPNTGLGSYAVDFIPNDTANYDWASDLRWILDRGAICECVNINVAKATVTEPTIASKVYTGDELTADITDSDIYTVTTNEGGTNVGNYDVVLTLKDVANYKWETDVNGTSDTVTLSFTIDQAENSWTTAPSIEGWTYGQTANTPTYEAKFGDDTVIVTYTGTANDGTTWNSTTAPSKAGNYKAIFTVDATDNYGRLENAVEFTIEKAVPALGTVSATITDNSTSIGDITLSRTDSSVDGILTVDAGQTLVWGANEIAYTFTPTDTHNYKTVTGKTTVTVKDTVVPNAEYRMGTDAWKQFVNTITFGLFCKDYAIVEIQATDTLSGVKTIEYYVANAEVTDFTNVTWQTYDADKKISLNATGKYIVYVLVTDNDGNTTTKGISTDGIVVYTDSTVTSEVSRVYKSSKQLDIEYAGNGNTIASITCGDKTLADGTDYTITENANADAIAISSEWLDALDAGEYTLTVKFAPQGVETIDGTVKETLKETITLIVEPAELTVTGATATGRDYDSTNDVAIAGLTITGVKTGDDVDVSVDGLTGTLSSANAGSYDSVTLSDLTDKVTLTGEDAGNYKLVFTSGTAVAANVTIARRAVTVTADAQNKVYGETDPALTYTVSGLVDGETLVGALIRAEGENVGEYAITQGSFANANSLTNANNPNYNITFAGAKLTITKALATVTTVPTANTLTYNGAAQALVTAGTAEGGEMMYSLSEDGTYIADIPTGTDAGDYTVWYYVVGDGNHTDSTKASVSVRIKDAPHIQGEEGKMGWEVILDEVEDVLEEGTGETVVVDMNGFTEVPGDFFEEIKGKDITVEFDLGNGIVWTVNGKDITGEDIAEIDFAVTISTEENPISNIPAQVINQVTGENYHMEISLAYDGEFGFTAVLSLNLKAENAGCFANLYYYNVAKNAMEFICTDEIAADGTADLTFTHASDYTIVITDESADAEEPETSDTGDSNSVALWTMLLMAGFGFVIAGKKRRVK